MPFLQRELLSSLITTVRADNEEPGLDEKQLEEIISKAAGYSPLSRQLEYLLSAFEQLDYESSDIEHIIRQARRRCLEDYKAKLRKCSEWASHDSMEYIMRTLDWNIFIIGDSTRLPIKFTACKFYDPKRKSLVILNLEGLTELTSPHFEPLTDIVERGGKDVQIAQFDWESPLVQALYGAICRMED